MKSLFLISPVIVAICAFIGVLHATDSYLWAFLAAVLLSPGARFPIVPAIILPVLQYITSGYITWPSYVLIVFCVFFIFIIRKKRDEILSGKHF